MTGPDGRQIMFTSSTMGPDMMKGIKEHLQGMSGNLPTSEPPSESDATVDPFVLLLSLENQEMFNSIHADLLSELRQKTRVVQVSNPQEALEHLADPGLKGVFVADCRLADRGQAEVLPRLVDWVQAGGTAVVGGLFPSFTSPPKFSAFFKKWNVSWKMGAYHRTTFTRQPAVHRYFPNSADALPTSYSMKAVHVKGVAADDVLYGPTDDSRLESNVFAATRITNLAEAPVVYSRLGSGFLGYVGDVNAEEESTSVVIAMLHL